MKIGIIGLPKSGRSSVFYALTGQAEDSRAHTDKRGSGHGIVDVPDEQLKALSSFVGAKKTRPCRIEFIDTGPDLNMEPVKDADGLCFVIRAFKSSQVPHPRGTIDAKRDLDDIIAELILRDSASVEGRLVRLKKDGKDKDAEGLLLEKVLSHLQEPSILKSMPLSDGERKELAGFQFLSAKPFFIVANIGEDEIGKLLPPELTKRAEENSFPLAGMCAKLEAEIQGLVPEERQGFIDSFGLTHTAREDIIRAGYQALGLITFYTIRNEEEVTAWSVEKGTSASQTAGKIHSDMEKGFIKAEVVSTSELLKHSSCQEAHTKGITRLEGKDYIVGDGDIINFKFSV